MARSFFVNGQLPKDQFLEAYFAAIIYCWVALKHIIDEERQLRQDDHYMKNFESVYDAAEAYRKEHYPDTRPEPY